MPRTRRNIQMIVTVSAPGGMAHRDVLAEVRAALVNSDPANLSRFTVAPIPRSRIITPRRPSTKRTMPLIDYINGASDAV